MDHLIRNAQEQASVDPAASHAITQ